MRIAIVQMNPTVGDLEGNSEAIIEKAHQARQRGADLAVFSELCVVGYPPQDLLENRFFVEAVQQALQHIAHNVPQDMGVIVGAPVPNRGPVGKRAYNAALLYEGGERLATVHKTLLPTYDIFDEHRYFEPERERHVVEWRGLKLGLHVCEDMWNTQQQDTYHLYHEEPVGELAAQGADLFINVSASPFSIGKHEHRNELIGNICRQHERPFVFANQVGANTEVIFDGDSRVHGADGTRLMCAQSFAEDMLLWDMDAPRGPCTMQHDDVEDLHDALQLGIRDYYHKTGIFDKALVGLSGGIDSAVTCTLAVQALGAEHVVGVTMPSEISSEGSVTDSEQLADNLGISFHEIPIKPAVDAFTDTMLADLFTGMEPGVAEENIQARSRGVTLMALSNKFNYLLLTTGNKSEMAVGYVTLYGDLNGGVAALSDVLKTRVYQLAEHINMQAGYDLIPRSTIEKPPSAELSPDQQDTDTLPPYDVLDAILARYIEEKKELEAIVDETGYDRALVKDILHRVDRNEYKRRQAPPGLRVSSKAFGIGRRLPIVMRWDRDAVRELAEQGEAVFQK